jgi:hypothetical protein
LWAHAAGYASSTEQNPTQPSSTPSSAQPSGGIAADEHASPAGSECPYGYPVKGNISSSGERIYHEPSSSWYTRTAPEDCFSTPGAAQKAGFRAPRG